MPASVSAYAQLVRRGSCWLVRVTQPGRIVWRSYRVADVSPTEAVARAGGRAGVASVAWQLSLVCAGVDWMESSADSLNSDGAVLDGSPPLPI